MSLKPSDVVAKFEAEFRDLLPRSFVNVFSYLKAKYGLSPKLPKYRSPSERHVFVGLEIFMPEGLPVLKERFNRANEEFLKNPFLAALGAPFDHLSSSSEAREKLRLFLSDCEQMSDRQFQSLQKYLLPPRTEDITWWISHTGPRILLPMLELTVVALVVTERFFKPPILSGTIDFDILRRAFSTTYFQVFLATAAIALCVLATLTAQMRRLFGHVLVILILPFYLLGKIAIFLLKKVQSLAYETLGQPMRFHLQGRIAHPSTCDSQCAAHALLSC